MKTANSIFLSDDISLCKAISRSLKICAQVEMRTIVAGYSLQHLSPRYIELTNRKSSPISASIFL